MKQIRDYVILVIDDDEDWLHAIKRIMSDVEAVSVIESKEVYRGIGMMVAQPVDFVLLDKNFAAMNGQSIRAEKFLKRQKIEFVYLTATTSGREMDKVRARGCDVWSKDTPFDVLRKMICDKLNGIERTHAI